jgi:rod shape-determining protein MreC
LAVYRRSSRARNVIAVLVLLALTLVTIDARSHGGGVLNEVRGKVSDGFAPLQRATHAALRPIGNFLTGALDYGSLKNENEHLRQQLLLQQSQAAQAQAEQAEAEQILKNERLDAPFLGGIPTVTVQIIDEGFSNFDNTITIDRGSANGIAVGQPVVAAGGLVGTVQSTAAHSSTIELLTDPNFSVGVALQGNNTGSAEGAGRTLPMKVTVITTGQTMPVQKVGDLLGTSGLQMEKFPKGIPVGRVSKVLKVPGAIEPDIDLTPVVNPTTISFLQVLLWSPQ